VFEDTLINLPFINDFMNIYKLSSSKIPKLIFPKIADLSPIIFIVKTYYLKFCRNR